MAKLGKRELAYNSTKGVPMANMNTPPTPQMREMNLVETGFHAERKAGSTWKGSGNRWK